MFIKVPATLRDGTETNVTINAKSISRVREVADHNSPGVFKTVISQHNEEYDVWTPVRKEQVDQMIEDAGADVITADD